MVDRLREAVLSSGACLCGHFDPGCDACRPKHHDVSGLPAARFAAEVAIDPNDLEETTMSKVDETIDELLRAREEVLAAAATERDAEKKLAAATSEMNAARARSRRARAAYVEICNTLPKILHSDVSGLLGAAAKTDSADVDPSLVAAESK